MKRIVTLLFLLTICSLTFAQRGNWGAPKGPSITGKITGQLLDSISQQPVEFASLVLINTQSGKEADGIISDERGGFKFTEVKIGTYDLHISFLGYNDKVIKGVELTKKSPDYDWEAYKWLLPASL